ncbi:MAG: hypothetical protein WCI73_09790, partial [Phycisphaerae bacterium]
MSSTKGIKLFQLAKELEINSKLLVEKLQAEQIPNIENYQSTVSHGLEATIRDWHKNGELADLIEKSKHIPSKSKKKASAKSKVNADDEGTTATMVAEAPGETETQEEVQAEATTETVEVVETPPIVTEAAVVAPPVSEVAPVEAVSAKVAPVHVPVSEPPAEAAASIAAEAVP